MAKPPLSVTGYVDDNALYATGYGELVDALLEYIPDLTWPLSVRTYARMRVDPKLASGLKAYILPIRRASWHLDGSACRPAVTAFIADQVGLPILGQDEEPSAARRRGLKWGEHLRLGLLNLVFGHMPFERTYDMSDGKTARLGVVQERMPQTIGAIHINQDGSIKDIQQQPYTAAQSVTINANALLWYTNEREGAAWQGQSLLRPSYTPWLIKHEIMRVHATSIRRFGMGVPSVEAPAGSTPGQVAEAQRLASSIRVGDQSGAGLPNGFLFKLTGLTGSVPDAEGFLRWLDQQMTGSMLAGVLDLGDTRNGSRALGESFLDLFVLALQAVADAHAEQVTDQLVVPLVDANWGEDEPAPRIVCGDVGAAHEVTAMSLQLLLTSGALSADPALEEYVRKEYKLPARAIPWVPPGAAKPAIGVPSTSEPGTAAGARKREVRAAPAGQFPRDPNAHELAAQTDFTAIAAAHAAALAALVAAWATITATWRAEILAEITAAGDVTALGALTVSTAAAATLLSGQMEAFATAAAERQAAEAAAQGVTVAAGAIDTARIDATAQAFADLIANSYTQSAARSALAAWGPDATATEVADLVGASLDTLTESSLSDSLSGALNVAQNEGRTATLDNDPGTVKAFYAASEILDSATCANCEVIDEHIFPSLAEAKAAYPQGGYLECLGRLRCRGIVVTVWSDELELAA